MFVLANILQLGEPVCVPDRGAGSVLLWPVEIVRMDVLRHPARAGLTEVGSTSGAGEGV
jgi:hypothetical protein